MAAALWTDGDLAQPITVLLSQSTPPMTDDEGGVEVPPSLARPRGRREREWRRIVVEV